MNALNRRFGQTAGMFGSLDAFQKGLFGKTGDVGVNVGKLLEKVQTLDNMARKSYGLNQIFRIFEQRSQKARALLSKYSRYMAFTHTPRVFGFGKGVTEEEKQQAGELAAYAALFKSRQLTDEMLGSGKKLINKDAMGNATVDPLVRKALEKAGTVTADEDHNSLYDPNNLTMYGPYGSNLVSGFAANKGAWYHIVKASDRATGEEVLYVNGSIVDTAIISPNSNFTQGGTLLIGQKQNTATAYINANSGFQGNVSIIRVYNRQLTPYEVRTNYNTERAKFGL